MQQTQKDEKHDLKAQPGYRYTLFIKAIMAEKLIDAAVLLDFNICISISFFFLFLYLFI